MASALPLISASLRSTPAIRSSSSLVGSSAKEFTAFTVSLPNCAVRSAGGTYCGGMSEAPSGPAISLSNLASMLDSLGGSGSTRGLATAFRFIFALLEFASRSIQHLRILVRDDDVALRPPGRATPIQLRSDVGEDFSERHLNPSMKRRTAVISPVLTAAMP